MNHASARSRVATTEAACRRKARIAFHNFSISAGNIPPVKCRNGVCEPLWIVCLQNPHRHARCAVERNECRRQAAHESLRADAEIFASTRCCGLKGVHHERPSCAAWRVPGSVSRRGQKCGRLGGCERDGAGFVEEQHITSPAASTARPLLARTLRWSSDPCRRCRWRHKPPMVVGIRQTQKRV